MGGKYITCKVPRQWVGWSWIHANFLPMRKKSGKIHAFLPPMKKILARFTRFFLRTVAGEAIIFKNAPRTVAGEAIILSAPHAVGLSGARMQHSSFNEDWMTLECSNSCIK